MYGSKEKKRECPSCALEVSAGNKVCPFCGYEFPPEQKGMTILTWIFVVLILLWLFFNG